MVLAENPPQTRRDPVVDEVHGQQIVDPYRWLEIGDSAETIAWVEAQNAYTEATLAAVPGRVALATELEDLLTLGAIGAPVVRGGRHFYVRREGRQNQPVLLVRDDPEGTDCVLLDPNAASEAGTVALDWWYPSPDGRLLAYGYSRDGDERSTLYVLDVDNGNLLPDQIPGTRAASVAWLPDSSGFYYTRFPEPGTVPEGDENYLRRVFFHPLGEDPQHDSLIFGEGLPREYWPWVQVSPDGRWLGVGVSRGPGRNDLYLRDTHSSAGQFQEVAVDVDALFGWELANDALYILTNLDAPRYHVFRADPNRPQCEHWQEIIPEATDAVLDGLSLAGGWLIATYLQQATSRLVIFGVDGAREREVDLPTLGTITGLQSECDQSELFFSFESFTLPTTIYRLPEAAGQLETWATIKAPVRPEEFTVRQEWYHSRDGTSVSMFIVHHRDLDRTQPHPTVLSGYGGFNVSRTPLFQRNLYPWLRRHGVFALPSLRGGGEYGESWHRAGMLEHKQNVFDDFIAAGEFLIQQGYTSPNSLGIQGGSNGGLLVGAVLTQRPELFRAVVCGVPLLDMLRYHLFLIARLWIPEYGSAEDPAQFAFLREYSPYHQVHEGTAYPAVLFTTAESDSRVDPLHARKMAALMQQANTSPYPILLRIETQAGHGIGKPLTKVIEEQVDVWTFLCDQLGMRV